MTPDIDHRALDNKALREHVASIRRHAGQLLRIIAERSPRSDLVRCYNCGCAAVQWDVGENANTGEECDCHCNSLWCPSCEEDTVRLFAGTADPAGGFSRPHNGKRCKDALCAKIPPRAADRGTA